MAELPKKIWFLWFQGLEEAPVVVRKCYESWKKNNSNWEIVFLDKKNLFNYVELNINEDIYIKLEKPHQADLIRLELLSRHGGVWVDATCFCMIPLDAWIYNYMSSGFFCFYKPEIDRVMSNWFIAAERSNPLIVKMAICLNDYWSKNNFNNKTKIKKRIIKKLNKILNKNDKLPVYWLSFFVVKCLRVYPYFIFHYMFARLVSRDNECRKIWENTKKISASLPHKILFAGILKPLTNSIKEDIDNNVDPLYKLTWKYPVDQYIKGSILYYLLEQRTRDS